MSRILGILSGMLYLFLCCYGCTLTQTMQDNRERREVKLPGMERELREVERQNRELEQNTKRLLSELDEKHATFGELDQKLIRIESEIRKMKAENEAEKTRKGKLLSTVDKYQKEVKALKARPSVPDPEKEAIIQDLKKEIQFHLQMGLK